MYKELQGKQPKERLPVPTTTTMQLSNSLVKNNSKITKCKIKTRQEVYGVYYKESTETLVPVATANQ